MSARIILSALLLLVLPVFSPASAAESKSVAADSSLTIPDIDDLQRISRGMRPSREAMKNSAFVLETESHRVDGDGYVVLTDHVDPEYLKPLSRLSRHRNGSIVRVEDLATLFQDEDEMARVGEDLRKAKVRYLAIAPRMDTYRENMLLGMWELISTLDEDPQLDAFPGLLLASGPEEFARLITRSIGHQPQSVDEIRPFAISQVPSVKELRSLQKAGILRKLFARYERDTPTVAVYSSKAADAPSLSGDHIWSYHIKNRGGFLKKLPEVAAKEFDQASLLIMHGHGIPGMSCGVDIEAIPNELAPEVILCGSCFSAAPEKSDFPSMRQAPGGYRVEARDAFMFRAVDRGATVAFGHMRLNQGFPHLYPVLETWLEGGTVGEAYQELINRLIEVRGFGPGDFTVSGSAVGSGRQPPQNLLLYVIIGDPAVQPFEALIR